MGEVGHEVEAEVTATAVLAKEGLDQGQVAVWHLSKEGSRLLTHLPDCWRGISRAALVNRETWRDFEAVLD